MERQLVGISNNINQLAHHVNNQVLKSNCDYIDFVMLKVEVNTIIDKINKIAKKSMFYN